MKAILLLSLLASSWALAPAAHAETTLCGQLEIQTVAMPPVQRKVYFLDMDNGDRIPLILDAKAQEQVKAFENHWFACATGEENEAGFTTTWLMGILPHPAGTVSN